MHFYQCIDVNKNQLIYKKKKKNENKEQYFNIIAILFYLHMRYIEINKTEIPNCIN
jgi:hypothetical protein